MKFSHSLQFNAVPEWSSKYIAYSNLKRLIYSLQREYLAASFNRNGTDLESSYLINRDNDEQKHYSNVFTDALDLELKKIEKFYREKEADTYGDFDLLIKDLEDFENTLRSQKSNDSRQIRLARVVSLPPEDSIAGSASNAAENISQELVDADDDDNHGIQQYRGRTNSVGELSLRARRNSNAFRSKSPDFWDTDYDALENDPLSALADIRITLKRRVIALFTLLSELKSYIDLNKTGFAKALKKFDKSLNTKLKADYIEKLVETSYIFSNNTVSVLKNKIDSLVQIYASLATNGSIQSAKSELRLHLREHVVWERNTVWKDLIGLERKSQNAGVARINNQKEVLVGDEDSEEKLNQKGVGLNIIKLISIALLTIILIFISPFEEVEQKNCFAILVCASLLWATETIPLFATSLLIPLLIVLLRVLKNDDGSRMDAENSSKYILASMWSSVIMLLLGGFTLAAALSKYNIAKIISTWILSKAGTNPKTILLTIMAVALFVSMWVSNVAAPVLCFSIIQSLLRTLPRGSIFAKQLILGIALASNIGGIASPIASPQNIISIGFMDPQPSWGQWFVISIPICTISLILTWAFLLVTFKSKEIVTIAGIRTVDDEFTKTQWFISIVTMLTIVLWCMAHQLEGIFGEMGIISIVPMLLFFGTGVLTGEDFNNFLWTIVVLAMGGIALGKAVTSSGLLTTIALVIQSKVEGFSLFVILIIFGFLILVVATFVSHTVAAVIIVPLVAEIGSSLPNPHPNLLVMAAAFLCSSAMGLPTSGFPNVTAISQVDDFGERYLTVGNFISRGVPVSIFCYIVVITLGYLLMTLIGF